MRFRVLAVMIVSEGFCKDELYKREIEHNFVYIRLYRHVSKLVSLCRILYFEKKLRHLFWDGGRSLDYVQFRSTCSVDACLLAFLEMAQVQRNITYVQFTHG